MRRWLVKVAALALGVLGVLQERGAPPSPSEVEARVKRRWRIEGALALAGLGLSGVAVPVLGVVPVKASSEHWAITAWFLDFAMERSVATHPLGIEAPPLDDPRLILMGAGHYEGGSRPCHGVPWRPQPVIPHHMTPHPPRLSTTVQEYDDTGLFSDGWGAHVFGARDGDSGERCDKKGRTARPPACESP